MSQKSTNLTINPSVRLAMYIYIYIRYDGMIKGHFLKFSIMFYIMQV
jgi:hypothetical protein